MAGRPPGRTARGEESREHIYQTALALIARDGYAATTLRAIAAEASVSPGLLYKYFPNKRAVVFALYDELSAEYARDTAHADNGPWTARFMDALRSSLRVLGPHRATLTSLTGVLVGDADESLLADSTATSRSRVQAVFVDMVERATDTPPGVDARALGRLLYLAHLLIILWWLLDKSPSQRATHELVAKLDAALPMAHMMLQLPQASATIDTADRLVRDALLGATSGTGFE